MIRVRGLCTRFGSHWVHRNLDLDVHRGEILALAGGSGSGKSTLLREIIRLQPPAAGSIQVLGEEVWSLPAARAKRLRRRLGVLFQGGALFGSLTVLENVGLPLREHSDLDEAFIDEVAGLKVALAGLPPDALDKYPSELSGGMIKRAALARAIALDPELLFLDEPTAGLDPGAAGALDELVLHLKSLLGLTMMVVTHDLDSLWRVADRVAVLGQGRVLAVGPMAELADVDVPEVQEYFQGPRARAAQGLGWKRT